ncbi:MAG: AAC(3) family N-acetyltransferase, partial [Clostridia bacterium]|nr:AAC(3) family N-acetyltransferase [Clostridia bacterium]
MFNEQAKQIIKKLYDSFDMDFAMKETNELFKLEYGQTFDNYKKASDYTYALLEKEGFKPELYTFKADGITTYQDKRMPIAWRATKGKLTVLSSSVAFSDPVVADFEKMPFALIKHSVSTPKGGIRTKLVTEGQVFAGEDCTGAMVLVDSRPGDISAFLDLGALGVVSDYLTSPDDNPDCTYWANACADDSGHWHVQSEDRDFIGFMVTPRIGRQLRLACMTSTVEVLVESDGERYVGEIDGITTTLKGKSDKEFWLLAHLYEPLPSDNSMGVVGAITILKAIRELVEKGQLPTPEYTVSVLFAMEHYGFAALYEALGTGVTDKVLGGLNIDGLPEQDKKTFRIIYPPYSSPFFANTFMRSALEVYGEVFPNKEYLEEEIIQFTDDTFLGDSTTKVPTMWLMYGVQPSKANQHNTCVTFDWLDREKFNRVLSVLGFVTMVSVCDIIPIRDMLENALRIANQKLKAQAKINSSDEYLSFFKRGEKQIILDFKKISNSPLIDEYASKIDDTYIDFDDPNAGIWQNYAKTIVPKRELKGFPFDRVRAPKGSRKVLPDRVIYGPFGLVLSSMDGKKNLEQIIREALWECGRKVTEEVFKEHIGAVFFLAEYGYISVVEKNPLTKTDLVSALKELGVQKSDLVLLHSALSGCGHLQGGENAIIDAFLECANTVLTPSFTRPYIGFEGAVNKGKNYRPFDKNDYSNIWTGSIPVAMMKRGAERSAHATHSWCGIGDMAHDCLKSHALLDP